jgi:hypothetical protein
MSDRFEHEWAQRLDRELKALPDVEAPPTLMARVMARVESCPAARQRWWSWHAWSPACRGVALAVLTACFAAAVFGAWHLWEMRATASLLSQAQECLAAVGTVARALCVLAGTLLLSFKEVNPAILAACGLIAAFSYFVCIGAGTLAVRFALVRNRRTHL